MKKNNGLYDRHITLIYIFYTYCEISVYIEILPGDFLHGRINSENHSFLGSGVRNNQFVCPESEVKTGRGFTLTVFLVSEKRIAEGGHLNSYLMSSSRVEFNGN